MIATVPVFYSKKRRTIRLSFHKQVLFILLLVTLVDCQSSNFDAISLPQLDANSLTREQLGNDYFNELCKNEICEPR